MHYALITGTGRSGTNWLLDMFDVSPETHCRNEPHGIQGTALNQFPLAWTSALAGSEEFYRTHWDEVAQGSASRYGIRDHNMPYPKPYLHPWSNYLGMRRALTGPRVRRTASVIDPRLRKPEWELPGWLGSRRRLGRSTGILKVLVDAPLLKWILAERTEIAVIHIVRHPGGRLNSWLNRFVQPLDSGQLVELISHRTERIRLIREFDQDWNALIPDPSTLDLIQMEVWFWRYVNETKALAGEGCSTYKFVVFDELAADPVQHARVLYEHFGLHWNSVMRERVEAGTSRSVFGAVNDSPGVATAWRSSLPDKYVEAIDEILADSPLVKLLTREIG